ncbi:thermosome-like protein [Paenibacillus sp. J31TS4]|uniref:TCP-1/cpn60 chaperonin family protein n=1 Tax=Paenibacillus sp. J31TS4 TaxID=2807195 RepID=UPI001B16F2BA|nr:TCP-1/cpn60 chaperonin family protein [Paenibacillus sp. J31TS4]GIP39580.1 thermosome-like protein [Paenibacillus sp. J31TS4]
MSQLKQNQADGDERHSTLLHNAAAIRAICSAVEGTLGPKGLDTMLVGGQGDVLITNDGVTILEKMDVSHPAARLMVQVARAQQQQVGDGTTTATVLAGALVAEGVAHVQEGVPVAKVAAGMQEGIRLAAEALAAHARPIEGPDDPMLYRIAYVAGREHADIARLVTEGARLVGEERLRDPGYRFGDAVVSSDKGPSEVWPGLLVPRKPAPELWRPDAAGGAVLVLQDALEPERPGDETLGTDAGVRLLLERREQFAGQLERLAELGVGLIATERGADAEAEQFCADRGILLLTRLTRAELRRIAAFAGAMPVRRAALRKQPDELARVLGRAGHLGYDEAQERVKLGGGAGSPAVSVVVGASTREVVGERARIAADAASAVQAAVRGGYVPGGGSVELAVARELERRRETMRGMEAYGVAAVARALRKPLAQMLVNAGFHPLEKLELVKASQLQSGSDALGIDCDTGELLDCLAAQIVDPAPVKIHAVQAAGEVAGAVLRIHTVVKMKG